MGLNPIVKVANVEMANGAYSQVGKPRVGKLLLGRSAQPRAGAKAYLDKEKGALGLLSFTTV